MTVTIQPVVHTCECAACKVGTDPAIACYHRQINMLLSRLTEPQRRWFAAMLSQQVSSPSDHELSLITGLDEKTIRRGRRELADGLPDTLPLGRQRLPGGGRQRAEKKTRPSKD